MTVVRPEWIDWLIVSNTGARLKENAPEEIKEKYEAYLKEHDEWEENSVDVKL